MKRPESVIAISIVQLVGSTFALGGAGVILLGAMTAQMADLQAHGSSRAALLAVVGVFGAFAAWGIVTALGLLWLRTWALISTLLFAFLLLAGGVGMAAVSLVANPVLDPRVAAVARVLDLGMGAVCIGLAVWWIAYFCSRTTQAKFFEVRKGGAPRLPVSLAVIGWYFLGGGAIALLFAPVIGRMGLPVAGHPVTGTAGEMLMVLVCAISMVVGLGVLELRRWARPAMLAWLALGLINTAVIWLSPGAWLHALARSGGASAVLPATTGPQAMYFSLGFVSYLAQMYFLWTRKAAFEPPSVVAAVQEVRS